MKKNFDKIIEEARDLGVLNETKVRNIEIRQKYRRMRNEGIKYDDAIFDLAKEYCLSFSSIQQIIGGKSKSKY